MENMETSVMRRVFLPVTFTTWNYVTSAY